MIVLDSISKKLEIVLAGSVTANQLEITAFYFDVIPQQTTSQPRSSPVRAITNNTTDVTVVASPALNGIRRNIHTIFCNNKDTAAATVTFKMDDGGTETIFVKQTLNAGDSLNYEHGTGWTFTTPNTAPFTDTFSIVKGSADPTKQLRFEVDGFTTNTTRVVTVPDADLTMVGTTTTQTLTGKTFTNPANTVQALTDQATITWDASLGAVATVTLAGSRTMAAPTSLKAGGDYYLIVTQDGTGGRTLTWNSVFKAQGGGVHAQPETAISAVTVFHWKSDGTNLYTPEQTPFMDTNYIVRGATDPTKKVRIEADGLTTNTTRVLTMPDADVTLANAATQADQETGTSTVTYVSPGRQHFHAGHPKAWGLITPATTVSAQYPGSASITRNSAGNFTVTHGKTMSSTAYAVVVTAEFNTPGTVMSAQVNTRSTTAFGVIFQTIDNTATVGPADPVTFSYAIYGDT